MKGTRMVSAAVVLTAALCVGVKAGEEQIGVGYQGMFVGEFLQGASVRGWVNDKVGLEANVMQADFDVADMYLLSAKAMYAPITHENSKFYIGVEGGFGQVDTGGYVSSDNADVTLIRPLFGAQYHFQGIPELGFIWEVGYNFASVEGWDVTGVSVSLGVHYYIK